MCETAPRRHQDRRPLLCAMASGRQLTLTNNAVEPPVPLCAPPEAPHRVGHATWVRCRGREFGARSVSTGLAGVDAPGASTNPISSPPRAGSGASRSPAQSRARDPAPRSSCSLSPCTPGYPGRMEKADISTWEKADISIWLLHPHHRVGVLTTTPRQGNPAPSGTCSAGTACCSMPSGATSPPRIWASPRPTSRTCSSATG